MKITDLSARRMQRDAELYRHLQACALLKLFRADRGREATTIEELEDWVHSLSGQHVSPSEVLTREEIVEAVRGFTG